MGSMYWRSLHLKFLTLMTVLCVSTNINVQWKKNINLNCKISDLLSPACLACRFDGGNTLVRRWRSGRSDNVKSRRRSSTSFRIATRSTNPTWRRWRRSSISWTPSRTRDFIDRTPPTLHRQTWRAGIKFRMYSRPYIHFILSLETIL